MFGDKDKVIHLVGIGGIGVSGLAEILHSLGFKVQGSDKTNNNNVKRLEKLGIKVFIGHSKNNIAGADVIVYSSAIQPDNIELITAQARNIPCLTRAEMLSQIVRLRQSVVVAGSHGKTTVTSLCANLLEMANFKPTVVNGGIINSYGTNAKLGQGDWAVIESDESDGSFVQFLPSIAIVTNIDKEHIKTYGTFQNLQEAFVKFIENVPFFGVAIICSDDPGTKYVIDRVKNRKVITYGLSESSDVRGIRVKQTENGTVFDVRYNGKIIENITTPLFGLHNVRNALSIVALSQVLDIDISIAKTTLANFTGVKRRFTVVGKINGVMVIDDYAHHPTEIRALLEAAHQRKSGKIVIIHQPHRFTRLNNLFDEFCNCFSSADTIVVLPVYNADGIITAPLKSEHLFRILKDSAKPVYFAENKNILKETLIQIIEEQELGENDLIIFSGAGDISNWAYDIALASN